MPLCHARKSERGSPHLKIFVKLDHKKNQRNTSKGSKFKTIDGKKKNKENNNNNNSNAMTMKKKMKRVGVRG